MDHAGGNCCQTEEQVVGERFAEQVIDRTAFDYQRINDAKNYDT